MDLRSGKTIQVAEEMETIQQETQVVSESETSVGTSQTTGSIVRSERPDMLEMLLKKMEELSQLNQQTNNSIDSLRTELKENMKQFEERITTELDGRIKRDKQETMKIMEDIQENINRNKKLGDSEIEKIKEEIGPMKEKLKIMENKSSDCTGIHRMGFERENDLKFYGDRRTHPVVFLKSLNDRVSEMSAYGNFKKFVRTMMKGSAEYWFDLIEEKCENIDEFNKQFLGYYWNDTIQGRIRENLFTGRYDETYGNSREEYAMKKIGIARYLEPQMSDGDIIKYLARHFNNEIRDVVAIQGIVTVERFLEYLRRIDDIKPVRRNRNFKTNQVSYRQKGYEEYNRNGKDNEQDYRETRENRQENRSKNNEYENQKGRWRENRNRQYEKKEQDGMRNKNDQNEEKYYTKEQDRRRYLNYTRAEDGKERNEREPRKKENEFQRKQNPSEEIITVDIEPTSRRQDFY